MADSSSTKQGRAPNGGALIITKLVREGILLALLAACTYLSLALFSYSDSDPGWSTTGSGAPVENLAGPAGALIADVFLSLFGLLAYSFPLLLAYQIWLQMKERQNPTFDSLVLLIRSIGLILIVVAGCGIAAIKGASNTCKVPIIEAGSSTSELPFSIGGYIGLETACAIESSLGYVGGLVILIAILLFGFTIFMEISWFAVMDYIGGRALAFVTWLNHIIEKWKKRSAERKQTQNSVEKRREAIAKEKTQAKTRKTPKIERPKKEPTLGSRVAEERQQSLFVDSPAEGELPAISLLEPANRAHKKGYSEESLEGMSRLLELKLKDFGVVVEVVGVLPGPVVTRFELQPAPGVKASRITNLSSDLARSLAVSAVRVVEVIQGKSVVGIEIPNEHREMVRLSEVVASEAYEKSNSPLTLALGHDISGAPVIADLAKMPHLLVAGTTGSGKSVGVNSMLISMLYKSSPEDVRLILVDPKMLELSVYEGIPHLLCPVITDMKEAATGLRWCVGEMERRYKLMAAMGVRNIAGYNKKVRDAKKAGQEIPDPLYRPEDEGVSGDEGFEPPVLDTLPFVVVVIDEFADMIMIVGKKVEQLIARIAQKARAAGIHLILATQRPSVDVITGLIKANVPTRMAFQVSSKIDSRTILDQGGAEQLLGHGDMLFLPPGTAHTVRVHGAFIDDHEVHRVVADWQKRGKPNYNSDIFSDEVDSIPVPGYSSGDESGEVDSESDPLYDEAVAFVTETRKVSISSVQRKLRIGYNRAARIVEQMEASGVVSDAGLSGNREVLAPPPPKH